MKSQHLLIVIALVGVAGALCSARSSKAFDNPQSSALHGVGPIASCCYQDSQDQQVGANSSQSTQRSVFERRAGGTAGGFRAYVDPQTGELAAPPVGAVTAVPEVTGALNTSTEGLMEVPGTTSAGGMTVDLRGRFRSTMVSTVDAAGRTVTRCLPDRAAGREQE